MHVHRNHSFSDNFQNQKQRKNIYKMAAIIEHLLIGESKYHAVSTKNGCDTYPYHCVSSTLKYSYFDLDWRHYSQLRLSRLAESKDGLRLDQPARSDNIKHVPSLLASNR